MKSLSLKSFNLVGSRINPLEHEQILAHISEWIRTHARSCTIVFANIHVVMESRQNTALSEALSAATLVVPDGMPIMLAARSRGYTLRARADGPGLMHKSFTHENCRLWRHYLYGGTPEVLSAFCQNYSDANVVGSYSPPFRPLTPEEDIRVIGEINASNADVLWVGLGCPKQEIWMFEHANRLQVPVMLGVGQAFDLLSGIKKRAPQWMRAIGMEWFYRLLVEPGRLWKRYLLYNPWFVWLYLKEQVALLLHY